MRFAFIIRLENRSLNWAPAFHSLPSGSYPIAMVDREGFSSIAADDGSLPWTEEEDCVIANLVAKAHSYIVVGHINPN